MRVLAHIATVALLLAVLAGIPLALYGNFPKIASALQGGADDAALEALEAAETVGSGQPAGHFTVALNRESCADADEVAAWTAFLCGGAPPPAPRHFICVALAGDADGIRAAAQLQSRLADGQIEVQVEDPVMALSKAELGRFDMLVVSDQMAEIFGAQSLFDKPFVEAVRL